MSDFNFALCKSNSKGFFFVCVSTAEWVGIEHKIKINLCCIPVWFADGEIIYRFQYEYKFSEFAHNAFDFSTTSTAL